VTSRNTQKRATSFTKEAAHRYVENLAISLANTDIVSGSIGKEKLMPPPLAGEMGTPTPQMQLRGRGYTISLSTEGVPSFRWNRMMSGDDEEKDSLPQRVMEYLVRHCLRHMPDGLLPCWTEIVSSKDDHRYRAHPNIYDGRPWFDHAMVKWKGYTYPLPACLHAFVDLRSLPPGVSIDMQESRSPPIEAGVYALLHSFSPVDDEREYPNSMIGEYSPDRLEPTHPPTLYLVDVACIVAPTVGIADVIVGNKKGSRDDRNHLFLFRRREEWPGAWDTVIDSVYSSRRNASPERGYEKDDDASQSDASSPPRKKRRGKRT
jgi:hypothetical protein